MTSSIFHRSEPPGIVTSSASGKSGKSKQKDKTKTYSQRTLDPQIRDRSIFMGIRDREIRNGTTGYFGPLVEWGHLLFLGLAQYRISTGPKIILKYCGTGSWTIFSFSRYFSYRKYGTIANLCYGTMQRVRGKFLTKRTRGHTLFCMVMRGANTFSEEKMTGQTLF